MGGAGRGPFAGGAGAWIAAKGAAAGAGRRSMRLGPAGPTERETGLKFPGRADSVDSISGLVVPGSRFTFAGAGPRAKSIMGLASLNVYAVGLLINPDRVSERIQAALRKEPDATAWAASASCQGALDELAQDHSVEKIIHLVVKFPRLKPPMLRKALDGHLKQPMTAGGQKAELEAFQKLSEGLQTRKGDSVSFCLLEGGEMRLLNNGEELGVVRSPLLCSELMGLYLGASAVSISARNSMAEGIHRIVTEA